MKINKKKEKVNKLIKSKEENIKFNNNNITNIRINKIIYLLKNN